MTSQIIFDDFNKEININRIDTLSNINKNIENSYYSPKKNNINFAYRTLLEKAPNLGTRSCNEKNGSFNASKNRVVNSNVNSIIQKGNSTQKYFK